MPVCSGEAFQRSHTNAGPLTAEHKELGGKFALAHEGRADALALEAARQNECVESFVFARARLHELAGAPDRHRVQLTPKVFAETN